jgi:uncharacterized protein (DUF362 family)
MDRREFIRNVLFGLALGGVGFRAFAKEPSVLALAENKDFAAATRDVMAALGGMQKFVKAGDTVVIKPNMGWDRKPEYAANTHPLVVKAIAEECVRAGAKRIKVFDNPCNDMRRCYENSGIQAALKGLKGVDVKYMDNERFKMVKMKGTFLKEWELYDEALSANVFINVPIAKHHSLTRLSLGLKNMMGIMGGNRGYLHRSMEEALADVNGTVKSHLVIIDATRVLLNHGPQGGDLRDVKVLNKVIAGTDVVAADAYATTLFGISPQEIAATVTAYKRGLGEMDLSKVKVVKA